MVVMTSGLVRQYFATATLVTAALLAGRLTAEDKAITCGTFLKADLAESRSLRRSSRFLAVDKHVRSLQLALVIDGTETMEDEFKDLTEGVAGLLRGIQEFQNERGTQVGASVVVYRDTVAGSVTMVLPEFESSLERVTAAIKDVKVQTGEPYFREQVDLGIHDALSKLPWAPPEDEGTARIMIVVGDAPPYPEGTSYRKHSTKELYELAQSKKVRVFGMVSASGFLKADRNHEKLKKTAEKERPAMDEFLRAMSKNTNGNTVDLLDKVEVQYWMTSRVAVPAISPDDIKLARQESGEQTPLRVAILPHVALPKVNFSADSSEAERGVSTLIREQLTRLDGVRVADPLRVANAWKEIHVSGAPTSEDSLGKLSKLLDVEYVVFGETTDGNKLELKSSVYGAEAGKVVATGTEPLKTMRSVDRNGISRLIQKLQDTLLEKAGELNLPEGVRTILLKAQADQVLKEEAAYELTQDPRALAGVLAGMDALEKSLSVPNLGDETLEKEEQEATVKLLQEAVRELDRAVAIEPTSPFAHYLLANCYFNLSRPQLAQEELVRYYRHLELAFDNLKNATNPSDPIATEIKAEFELMIRKDIAAAIALYESLATHRQGASGRFAQRAHWMLAGIRLGDWGVMSASPEHVDPAKARQHILTILARWPDSPQAAFYQKCIKPGSDQLVIPVTGGQLAGSP